MGLFDRFGLGVGQPNSMRFDPVTGMPIVGQAQPHQPYGMPGGPIPPWGQPGGMGPQGSAPQRPQQPQQPRPPQMAPMAAPGPQMTQADPMMGMGAPPTDAETQSQVNWKPPPQPVERQQQPGEEAQKKGGLFGRFGEMIGQITSDRQDGFNRGDLLQMGLSLLGNAEGSNWAGVADDYGDIRQGIQQRVETGRQHKREDTADVRETEQFKAWQAQQADTTAKRERWEAARANADPETQKILDQLGPEGYGQFLLQEKEQEARLAAERLAAGDRERLTQMEIDARAREGAASRSNDIAVANMRRLGDKDDRSAMLLNQVGVEELAKDAPALGVAMTTLSDIGRMKAIVQELGAMSGMSNPFSLELRTMFERAKGPGGTDAGRLIEEFENLQSNIVSQRAQALKPVSNADFTYFQKVTPNANMSAQGAMNILNNLQEGINWDVESNAFKTTWNKKHGGLAGTLDDQGRTWQQARGARPVYDPSKYGMPTENQPATAQTWDKLPPVDDFKEGEVIVSDSGQRMRRQGKQWLPAGKANGPAINNPGAMRINNGIIR